MSDTKSKDPIKDKPPIPVRKGTLVPNFSSNFASAIGNYEQNEAEMTVESIHLNESELKEFDDFKFEYNSDDENQTYQEDLAHQTMPEKLALNVLADKTNQRQNSDRNSFLDRFNGDNQQLGFSFGKFNDDLLLNESANILINNSGNLNQSAHKNSLESNKSLNKSKNQNDDNNQENSESISKSSIIDQMFRQSFENFKRISSTSNSNNTNGNDDSKFNLGNTSLANRSSNARNSTTSAKSQHISNDLTLDSDAYNKENLTNVSLDDANNTLLMMYNRNVAEMNQQLELVNENNQRENDHDTTIVNHNNLSMDPHKETPSSNENLKHHLTLSNSIFFKPNQGDLSIDTNSLPTSSTENLNVVSSFGESPIEFVSSDGAPSDNENPFDATDTNDKIRQEIEFDDFVKGEDYKAIFDKDEQINRKEFASNDLTINEPSSSNGSQEKTPWWNAMIQQQTSKLELSSFNSSNLPCSSDESVLSYSKSKFLSVPSLLKRKSQSPNKPNDESETQPEKLVDESRSKKVVQVDRYFNRASDFPDLCAQSAPGIDLSQWPKDDNSNRKLLNTQSWIGSTSQTTDHDKVISQEKPKASPASSTTSSKQTDEPASSNEDDLTFSNSQSYTNGLSSSNFSFTFNCSETGDLLIKKTKDAEIKSSKKSTTDNNKLTKMDDLNLDKIGEELKNISNRLNPDEKNRSESDENKSKESDCKKSKMPNITGSLTSTPSKLKKASSKSNRDLTKSVNSDTSSLNIVSGAPQMRKLGKLHAAHSIDLSTESSNNLFTQESFISSIPERTVNDSTLSVKSRHKSIQNNHQHKKQKHKHAEIQTSPEQPTFTSSTTIEVPNKLTNSKNDDSTENVNDHDKAKLNRLSTASNVSSASMISSRSNIPQSIGNPGHELNVLNNFTNSMISNSGSNANMTNPGSFVPVAFVPIETFFPCVKKMYDSVQPSSFNNSNLSQASQFSMAQNASQPYSNQNTMRYSNNDFDPFNNRLNIDTTTHSKYQNQNLIHSNLHSSLPSVSSMSSTRSTQELPQIELSYNKIDFGMIAEGCRETEKVFFNIPNAGHLNENCFIQVEVSDCSDWTINEYKQENVNKSNKFDYDCSNIKIVGEYSELKAKLHKAFSVHLNRELINSSSSASTSKSKHSENQNNKLRLPIHSNVCEFFVHMDTRDINYFKEQIYYRKNSGHDSNEQLAPLMISAKLHIYFCNADNAVNLINGENFKKSLIKQLDLKMVLGYAHLKSSYNINSIEFALPSSSDLENDDSFMKSDSSKSKNEDIDKTFTGNSILDGIYLKTNIDRKSIQFSNAGNINIKINCYFNYEETETVHHKFNYLSFNEYEIKIEKPLIFLEANFKANKPQIFLHGNIKRHLNEENNVPMSAFDQNKIKLIIEISPNGTSFEIPVRLRLQKDPKQSINRSKVLPQSNQLAKQSLLVNSNEKLRLNASKSILFFGKAIYNRKDKLSTINNTDSVSNQTVNELLLQNINSVPIRCELILIDSIETKTRSSSSLDALSSDIQFRFHAETLASCLHFDENKKTIELSIEPGKFQVIKLEYISLNKSIPLSNAHLRIRIADTFRYFHISLIGFSRDTFLDVENVSLFNLFEKMKSVDEETAKNSFFMQLLNSKIRQYSYCTEMNRFIPPVQPKQSFSQRSNYRKLIILKNKSPTSKCVVYPLLFDSDLNKQLVMNTKLEDKSISNEKWYDLGTDKYGQRSILKILYKMNTINKYSNRTDSTGDLHWFELQPNEEYHLNFELITIFENQSISSASIGQSYSNINNLDSFYLALLWIEYDINSYCILNYQQASLSNDLNKKSNFIDRLLEKIISQNNLVTRESFGESYRMNRSTSSSMSSLISVDQSILSVNGSSNKSYNRSEFINLMRSSFKCSLINITKNGSAANNSTIANESITRISSHLPDYYFAASDQEISSMCNDESIKTNNRRMIKSVSLNLENSNLKNMSSLDNSSNKFDSMSFNSLERSDLLKSASSLSRLNNDFRSRPNVTESWSVSNHLIIIQNIQKERQISSYAYQFYIQNNLSTKNLRFEIHNDSFMISFDRLKFELMPSEKIAVKVIPTKEIFNKQKWDGSFSIWCNNLQKNIRVVLSTTYVDENTISDSTLMDDSSFKHPGSIMPSDSSTPFISNPNFLKTNNQPYNQKLETINDHELIDTQSDLAQSTLDSLSITPLMNASYLQNNNSTLTDISMKDTSKFFTPELRAKLNDESQLKTIDDKVRITSSEDRDVKFIFPKIPTMTKKSIEILFSNPTKSNVYWEASSVYPVTIKDYKSRQTNDLNASKATVFSFSPRSGRLLYLQKQPIIIEFNPGDVYGQFNQTWEIRTWADSGNTSQESYSCQMKLSGESTSNENSRFLSKDVSSRSASRLDGSKDSLTMVSSIASRSTSSLHSDRSLSGMNVSSSLSSKTAVPIKKVNIKESQIVFSDLLPYQSTKSFLIVNNPDDVKHALIVRPLVDPFYCKHSRVEVDSKHCIKIPIEFKPKVVGDFSDKIYICVDSDDQALNCILKAKCISSK